MRNPTTASASPWRKRTVSRPRSTTRNWRSPSVKAMRSCRAAPKPDRRARTVAEVPFVVDDSDPSIRMRRREFVGDGRRGVARPVVHDDDLELVREGRAGRPAPPPRGHARFASSLWAGKKYDSAGDPSVTRHREVPRGPRTPVLVTRARAERLRSYSASTSAEVLILGADDVHGPRCRGMRRIMSGASP